MKIHYFELFNFKGLKKFNYKYSSKIDPNNEIILISGENGYGKTTILENLHPYPEMITRKIKESIIYPAKKIIIWEYNNNIYKSVIEWVDEKTTKGYLYLNDTLIKDTEKGNITEYLYQIEKILEPFEKFKNSVFLAQNSLKIIEANPSKRLEIINQFLPSLEEYDKHKEYARTKENEYNILIKKLKEELNNYLLYEDKYKKVKEMEKFYNEKSLENVKKELQKLEEKYNEYSKYKTKKLEIEKNKKELEEKIKNMEEKITKEKLLKEELKKLPSNIEKKLEDISNNLHLIDKVELLYSSKIKNNFKNFKTITEIKNLFNFIKNNNEEIIKYKNLIQKKEDLLKKEQKINQDLKTLKEKIGDIINKLNFLNKNITLDDKTKYKIIQKLSDNFNLYEKLDDLDFFNFELNYKEINIEELKRLEQEIEKIKEKGITTKSLIVQYNKRLEELKNEYNSLKHYEKITKNLENIKKLIKKYEELQNKLNILKNKKLELEKVLSNILNKSICPLCKQKITVEHKTNIEEEVKTINTDIIKINNEIQNIENELKLYNLSSKDNINSIEKDLAKFEKLKDEIRNYQKKLNELPNIEELRKIFKEKQNEYLQKKLIFEICNYLNDFKEDNRIIIQYMHKIVQNYKQTEIQEFKEIFEEIMQLETNQKTLYKEIEEIDNNIDKISSNQEFNKYIKILFNSNIIINLEDFLSSYENLKKIIDLVNIKEKVLDVVFKKIEDFIDKKNYYIIEKEKLENQKNKFQTINEELKIIKEYKLLLKEFRSSLKTKIKEIQSLEKILEKDYYLFEEEYLNKKEELSNYITKYNEFVIEKNNIEKIIEEYQKKQKEKINYENLLFQWKRLKLAADKIKKTIISSTFTSIIDKANKLLNNEGTIKIQLAIKQISDKKFNIYAIDLITNTEVEDISLLSGAEKATVQKALSIALSSQTNLKALWIDEADASLSESNKNLFVEMLEKIKNELEFEQIFLISHNPVIKEKVDWVIELS